MAERGGRIRTSRCNVLSTVAGTGIAAVLGAIGSNHSASIEELLLGTFESTLDGWRADGEVALSRVDRSDRPIAVTEGEYALDVVAKGESTPAISRPVTDPDLSTHPYFVADVAPDRVTGSDAPVAFRFRLYRPTDELGGSSEELVAESTPVTARQAAPGRIYWDARDVETDLFDAVSRLEIGWYPADHDPDSFEEAFAYRGRVVFDAIRATASVDPVGSAHLAATMRDLQFDHGAYVRTEVTDEFDGGEAGTFVFADGATEEYRFETLAADRFLLVVADTEIAFGGGWD